MSGRRRTAVLVDCASTSPRWFASVLEEVDKLGAPLVRRAYADWARADVAAWRDVVERHGVQQVQVTAHDETSYAAALTIDAMDLLHEGGAETFCLVSGDGDLTRLALRLRQAGKRVHAIGTEATPAAYRNACDWFTRIEVLAPEDGRLLKQAIRAVAQEDGWAPLSRVGWRLVSTAPTRDSRSYGYQHFRDLLHDLPFVRLVESNGASGPARTWVSLRQEA